MVPFIPFNRPFLTGRELEHMAAAMASGKLSGNGEYTQKCQTFFSERYGFPKSLLTTSCTDALEMAALLCEVGPGDEVILPSFTFVSTANAFALRGADLVFVDSQADHPNMDAEQIEGLITSRTKVIVPVHYAGAACDMDRILGLARPHGIRVVEDAAQAIDATYKGRPLGSLGDLAAFSFHETKNIGAGEGGMLVVNNPAFAARAEILWEKGTNRSAFFRGEVDKYGWVDVGSSFLPSELTAAFLFAQVQALEEIQRRRLAIWNRYHGAFTSLEQSGLAELPKLPAFASCNAHMYYLVCPDGKRRQGLIDFLKARGILAVFHYQSLHRSPFYGPRYRGPALPNADRLSDCLVRLPLFADLSEAEQGRVTDAVLGFFSGSACAPPAARLAP